MCKCPDVFNSYFTYRNTPYATRYSNYLYVPRRKTVMGSLSSAVQGPKFWNSITGDLATHRCTKNFKKKYVKSVIATYGDM